jgi:hypothetical protein
MVGENHQDKLLVAVLGFSNDFALWVGFKI